MNWTQRLQAAEKRLAKKQDPFTDEDIELSQLWTTGPLSEIWTSEEGTVVCWNNDIAKGPLDLYLVIDSIYFTKGV